MYQISDVLLITPRITPPREYFPVLCDPPHTRNRQKFIEKDLDVGFCQIGYTHIQDRKESGNWVFRFELWGGF